MTLDKNSGAGLAVTLIFAVTGVTAFIRSGGPTTTVSSASDGPSVVPQLTEAIDYQVESYEASQLCMQRFFSPFAAIAGDLHLPTVPTVKVETTTKQSDVSTTTTVERDEPLDQKIKWREGLEHARAGLIRRFPAGPTSDEADDYPIEVVIATIPDPVDSGLGYQYDVQLQALQHGLESPLRLRDDANPTTSGEQSATDVKAPAKSSRRAPAHYNRDRGWLPWDDRIEDGSKRPKSVQCRTDVPGVMLFRNTDLEHPSVLVALLVGETPTSGVHNAAMRRALEVDAALRGSTSQRSTRILGPTYSGSAFSLREAIKERACEAGCPAVEVVSGSANGASVPVLLASNTAVRSLANLTFHSTTLQQTELTCTYLHFVRKLGVGDGSGDGDEDDVPGTLDGVAILQELGTEFGNNQTASTKAATQSKKCPLSPERYLSFPVHISRIRDAYEAEDKALAASRDATLARPTSLPVSLREPSLPLDLQTQASSGKTTNAQDLSLAHVLGAISREGIRYVGIEATDIGDAIFLARKIRDVAPDVRIAFFSADALLLHPSFRNDLMGSLVVSAFPFLGAADFELPAPQESRRHAPFESDIAEATFNAALALRHAEVSTLIEYDFIGANARESSEVALPVWVSAIGRSGLTPLIVRRSRDRDHILYARAPDRNLPDSYQLEPLEAEQAQLAAHSFDTVREQKLHLDNDVTPPRFWQFLFAILSLVALLDFRSIRAHGQMLGSTGIPHDGTLLGDRNLDLAFARMKWMQYAYLRTAALSLMLLYFVATTALALRTYTLGLEASSLTTCVVLTSGFVMLSLSVCLAFHYLLGFRAELSALGQLCQRSFGSDVRSSQPVAGNRIWAAVVNSFCQLKSQVVGHDELLGYESIVYSSFARLRSTYATSLLVLFVILFGTIATLIGNDSFLNMRLRATPLSTLFTLRNLSLVEGLSASTPLLLCLATFYFWAAAGMQRARGTHLLSSTTPKDGVYDGAATPIASVLFPKRRSDDEPAQEAALEGDGGFVHLERALTNPILRLNSMSRYMAVLVVTLVLPVILFMLKPPTALEPKWAGRYLFVLLVLCGFIICVNLLQFFEHWRALSALLARLNTHPLAAAFDRVLPVARMSVDEQLTRAPSDLEQFTVCAREYDELAAHAWSRVSLETDPGSLELACASALEQQTKHPHTVNAMRLEGAAGQLVIESARAVFSELEALDGSGDGAHSAWKSRAQGYVATVIALVLNRHIRQVRPFIWGTTLCAMLLLAATVSYPFEPHRALLTCIWIITLAVVGLGMFAFVSLDSDKLLSRIANTKPGHVTVNRAFALRVAVWVVVPLVAVVAAQYPQVADVLGAVIDPLTRTLR